jgi:hypothetical protein
MGRDPRWLNTESKRVGKETSSVVITFVGQLTMKGVVNGPPFLLPVPLQPRDPPEGLHLIRTHHPLRPLLPVRPPHARCTTEAPTCAVFDEPHLTRKHPCAIPSCLRGYGRTLPPFRCGSCNGPHKDTDRACPTYCMRISQCKQTSDTPLA